MDKICSDSQPRQFWADVYYFLLMETKIVSESFDFRSAPMRVLALEDFSLQVSTKVSCLKGSISVFMRSHTSSPEAGFHRFHLNVYASEC
jgi:hypothetical protein